MTAWYNEIDEFAAQWLRNLIRKGHIADGVVDTRSIRDVHPDDLKDFTQCHFFAGIGVWSHSLRLAGWPDDRHAWTGSCPCQPFSAAGKGAGFADDRHLWPEFHRLIAARQPLVVFGEQVASKDGLAWLDTVCTDLEGSGYAVGAVDLCAAGVGAPHIRQRLWFAAERLADALPAGRAEGRAVARDGSLASSGSDLGLVDDDDARREGDGLQPLRPGREGRGPDARPAGPGAARRMGDDDDTRLEGQRGGHTPASRWDGAARPVAAAGEPRGMADAEHDGRRADEPGRQPEGRAAHGRGGANGGVADGIGDGRRAHGNQDNGRNERAQLDANGGNDRPGPVNGDWRAADWLYCRDGKWRPVEPGSFPLAHGVAGRVGRLRAYGNAIVPQAASEVIAAFMECRP